MTKTITIQKVRTFKDSNKIEEKSMQIQYEGFCFPYFYLLFFGPLYRGELGRTLLYCIFGFFIFFITLGIVGSFVSEITGDRFHSRGLLFMFPLMFFDEVSIKALPSLIPAALLLVLHLKNSYSYNKKYLDRMIDDGWIIVKDENNKELIEQYKVREEKKEKQKLRKEEEKLRKEEKKKLRKELLRIQDEKREFEKEDNRLAKIVKRKNKELAEQKKEKEKLRKEEEKWSKDYNDFRSTLSLIPGLNNQLIDYLGDKYDYNPEKLAMTSEDTLMQIPGIGLQKARAIDERFRKFL